MRKAVLSHALVCGTIGAVILSPERAAADGVQSYSGDDLLIRFAEPVVPQSACRMPDSASATDKKTDIFTLSGDPAHPPVARWLDQNRLQITFPKGSSCATEYRLSFLPGRDKYLGEKPMPQSSFSFHRPPTHLVGRGVPGMQAGTFIVFPRDSCGRDSNESLDFGTASGVTYTYRRVKQEQNTKDRVITVYTGSVPAEIAPARLKHGLPAVAAGRLAEQNADWAALTPDSPLPGVVLVQPQHPLPEGTQWELFCEAPAGKGFISGRISSFVAHQGLDSHVTASYGTAETAAPTPRLSVAFSAPLTGEEARRVFRESVFSVGGIQAATNAGGTCKRLKTGGKEYRFFLREMLPPTTQDHIGANRREDCGKGIPSSYTPPGICSGFTVEVEGPTPLLLDIRLPGDICAALGQKTTQAQSHRLTINPAWPRLRSTIGGYAHTGDSQGTLPPLTLLPLKGDHKVIVPMDNVSALRATAYRIPTDMLAKRLGDVKKALEDDPQGERAVMLKCRLERHNRGLQVLQEEELRELRTELGQCLASRRDSTARHLTAELGGTAERDIAFPPCDSPDCGTTEAVVDLDALCGSSAPPGFYLLRLSSVTSPSVRAALADLGLAEDTLDCDRYALLQVSDLRLSFNGESYNESILLTRLSDGKPVPHANVTIYLCDEDDGDGGDDGDTAPAGRPSATVGLKDGFASLQAHLTKRALYGILVESGGDCALHHHFAYRDGQQGDYRSVLQTDRELYSPGDEVYVRGIFRRYDEGNATPVSSPKEGTPVVMSVHTPGGKELFRRGIPLDTVGAFSEHFTLPAGEEDVTGSYLIRVQSADGWDADTSVQSEIFRRDSFIVNQELEMDPVAPQQFTLRLTATDYNATPLAGGKVELHFSSPVPLLHLGGTDYPAPPAGAKRNHKGKIRLTTDAEGKAELRGTFAPSSPRMGVGSGSPAPLPTTARNMLHSPPRAKRFSLRISLSTTRAAPSPCGIPPWISPLPGNNPYT